MAIWKSEICATATAYAKKFFEDLWGFVNVKFVRQLQQVHVEFFTLPLKEKKFQKNFA